MQGRFVPMGLALVAIAGAWWLMSSILDSGSALTHLATGGIMIGALAVFHGLMNRPLRRPVIGIGFLLIGVPSLVFGVVEARESVLLVSTFILLFAGTAIASYASLSLKSHPMRAFNLMRIGLLIAATATAVWGLEKLLAPDLEIPPYLIAPVGFFLTGVAIRTRQEGASGAVATRYEPKG